MSTSLEFGLSNALVATVLALAAFGVTRMVRRPEWVFGVWLLVLAKLLMPPFVGLPLATLRTEPAVPADLPAAAQRLEPEFLSFESPADDSFAAAESSETAMESSVAGATVPADNSAAARPMFSWLVEAVFGIWLVGSAIWFVVAAVRVARFRRILRHAEPAPAALRDEVSRLAKRIGLRRAPQVRLVNRRIPPLVWAMTDRATILLPAELLPALSDEQRATLLAHELVHLKRRDHLVRWIELAALGLYWWHPVAWWARRNIERAAEQCCDAQVVALSTRAARAYAEALLTTVDFLAESRPWLPVGASGFSQARHVKRRMEMILHGTVARPMWWPFRLVFLAIGLLVLPLSIRTLWAEPSSPAQEETTEAQSVASPTVVEVRVQETQRPQESSSHQATANPDRTIEERLDRLEKMIQALADQKQTSPAPSVQKSTAPAPAQLAIPAFPPYQNGVPVFRAVQVPPPVKVTKRTIRVGAEGAEEVDEEQDVDKRKDAGQLSVDAEKSLLEIRRTAELNIELSKTNYNRRLAAERQFEAVKAAYEAETVTLDQWLEAQRRLLESRISYALTACGLAADPDQREYVLQLACLNALNQALNDARGIWRQVHREYVDGEHGGVESRNEAQARKQYFSLKSQTQSTLDDYLKAKAAWEGRKSTR